MTEQTISRIRKFTADRDWDQFHTPVNLAKAINIEASELLEQFIWSNEYKDITKLSEELADVLIYSILLAEKLQLDISDIILDKLSKNAKKYPIDKSYNNSKKYNEFD